MPTAKPGQVLADRYRIERKIGEGGMGEVWQARHVYIEKTVALKLLRPEVASPEVTARFQQEARAASLIGHVNIVHVDDFGRLPDGTVYLAMEYLEGEDLDALMERGRIPLPRAIDIMCQVCRGLGAAHAKGIVHRDIKPENIFLVRIAEREVVKILDFGIAKITSAHGAASSLTKSGSIFGTPHYMSPQQALGRSLDAKSDIYSCGVILYQLLTGMVPFKAETFMGILTQHINADPVPPRELDRECPAELQAIVLRAMAKAPTDRQADVGELGAELGAARAHLGGTSAVIDALLKSSPPRPRSQITVTATPGSLHGAGGSTADLIRRSRGRGRALAGFALVAVMGGVAGFFILGRVPAPAAGGDERPAPVMPSPAPGGSVPPSAPPPAAAPTPAPAADRPAATPSAATRVAASASPAPSPSHARPPRPHQRRAGKDRNPYELLDGKKETVIDPYK